MPTRARVIDSFKVGETSVLVTNPHTLAESVSLHGVCHDAVYFECSYNLVHLLQSKDRIHRLGLPQELVFKGLFDDEGQRSEVSDQGIADDTQERKEM